MVEHSYSTEWWLGYHCLLPKTRNPCEPSSQQALDWLDGWQTRFYGEKPHKEQNELPQED